ncbi:MAG: hypothetical protein ACTHJ0_05715 [Flavipsychrobacter sp.]
MSELLLLRYNVIMVVGIADATPYIPTTEEKNYEHPDACGSLIGIPTGEETIAAQIIGAF